MQDPLQQRNPSNRTRRNLTTNNAAAAKYTWDPLNRMTNQYRPSVGASYYYRADGVRVEEVEGVTINWTEPENEEQASGHYDLNYAENRPTTRYFYDGQMPMEEDYNPSGSITKVTRNTLGGRGIDMISTTQSSTTTLAFPLYDGHGNMVATLSRGTSSYSVGNQRTYDVWGSVRSGSATGDPAKRYCANLGHQADDESDLIYMRARYYEPGSGRFVSEDPVLDGSNGFVYVNNNPVSKSDPSGLSPALPIGWYVAHAAAAGLGFYIGYLGAQKLFRAMSIRALEIGTAHASDDMEDVDWLTNAHDNFFVKVVSGGIAAVTEALLLHNGWIAWAPRAGSIGLAFGTGLLLGFLIGFYSDLILAFIHEADEINRGVSP